MAYAYYLPITIPPDPGLTGAGVTDFTFTRELTHADLRTVANGGRVWSGSDIDFYGDGALAAPVKWARIEYDPVVGRLLFAVKAPLVSKTVAQVLYLAFGDPTVVTDQQDRANAWDTNTVEVWRGESLTGLKQGLAMTNRGTAAVAQSPSGVGAATIAGKAFGTDGTATGFLARASAPLTTEPLSISALFKPVHAGGPWPDATIAGVYSQSSNARVHLLAQRDPAAARSSMRGSFATSGAVLASGEWRYACASQVAANDHTIHAFAANGSVTPVQSTAASANTGVADGIAIGGNLYNGSTAGYFTGQIAEVRVHGVARGADWIRTEYRSLIDHTAFSTVGPRVDVSPSIVMRRRRAFLLQTEA